MTLDYELYKEGALLNDRYQKLEDISEGAYGLVSLAKDTQTKRLVAVKYIYKLNEDGTKNFGSNTSSQKKMSRLRSKIDSKVKSKLSKNICFEALYEVDIQTKVGKHPNITELFDFFDSYIIMEYCQGGDMYEAIRSDMLPTRTSDLVRLMDQLMDAIEFVHEKGIYHRDIKPENILISANTNIKLTDWGLATTELLCHDRNVGSDRYMAPELFESNLASEEVDEPYDASKVDIWAIGIVMLNMVFHRNAFTVANETDKAFCYFAANREALFDVFSTMSYDFFQVLRYSLTMDPTNRNLGLMRGELKKLGEFTIDGDIDDYTSNGLQQEEPAPLPKITVQDITPASSAKPINQTIIKNHRKPLAIPTPNTHINNFMDGYNPARSFNAKDFFTPPSVNNRYMDGVFRKKKTRFQSPRNSYNPVGRDRDNRRGSVTSYSSSTGKYIPPHSRGSFSGSFSGPSNLHPIPSISTVMETHDNDLDDVLFSLDENSHDEVEELASSINRMGMDSSVPSLLQSPFPPSSPRHQPTTFHSEMSVSPGSQHFIQPSTPSLGVSATTVGVSATTATAKKSVYVPPHHRSNYQPQPRRGSATKSHFVNSLEAYKIYSKDERTY